MILNSDVVERDGGSKQGGVVRVSSKCGSVVRRGNASSALQQSRDDELLDEAKEAYSDNTSEENEENLPNHHKASSPWLELIPGAHSKHRASRLDRLELRARLPSQGSEL